MSWKRYVCIECGGRRWLTPVEWWVSVCQVCEGELEEDESPSSQVPPGGYP